MKTKRVKSVRALIEAHKFFAGLAPDREVKVEYGEYWKQADFFRWFWDCLDAKINRDDKRTWRKLSYEYQMNMMRDARRINEHYGRRIRQSGRNILSVPEMKKRYPHIDNPEVFA